MNMKELLEYGFKTKEIYGYYNAVWSRLVDITNDSKLSEEIADIIFNKED